MIHKKKTFIIAELSANHNNDYNLAVKTMHAMANSGADAVKVQTYKPESLTLNLDTGYFAKLTRGLWKGYTPWKLFKEAAMPYEWQPKLKKVAEDLGMIFFSSPFDKEGVDFLESINISIYKIASPEINDIPLIEYIASKGKPVIISTGLANIKDIEMAIDACKRMGNNEISLLKCTSQYPAPIDAANLNTITDMQKRFKLNIGLSDHSFGSIVPVVAVSLGATIVEKHFTLDRSAGGPDADFSMEPDEFKKMVGEVRAAEKTLGKISYDLSEQDKLRRRSLFAVKDIKKGELITNENVRSIRPGHGLNPKLMHEIVGKKAKVNIPAGTALKIDLLD